MILNFYKEADGKWFIDLPDYPGPKGDLEMILGADDMLNRFCEREDTEVSIEVIHTTKPDRSFSHYTLEKLIHPIGSSGQWYLMNHMGYKYVIWLCDVTKYVFSGDFPDYINFKLVEEE